MTAENKSRAVARKSADARSKGEADAQADGSNSTTPSTDMQPEDVGTPESGAAGHGTEVESAMKQTSKTPTETGSKR